jgi:hypothetical protein
MLLAAAAGLALSASGCIIDGSSSSRDTDGDGIRDSIDLCPAQPEDFNGVQDGDGCPDGVVCLPDLTVSWRIVSNLDGQVITCAEAGNADTVTAWIDGGGLTALTAFDTPCPANASTGQFIAELPSSGTYNVSLELTHGATLLSETPVLVQPVDCSGLSATPRADMLVNF